ncbi:MAG: hypothetical protein H7320_13100 [Ferruginibacter sp.]|nr:hypothetical protein [Ferruginibacter sp.]
MAKINFKKIQGRLGSAAGLVAGSVAGSYAKTAIDKMGKGKVSPLMSAGIRMLVGAALPSVIGHNKPQGFFTDFSNGMLAEAGYSLAKELKVPGISGTDIDMPVGDYHTGYGMNGTDIDSPVSGTNM